MSDANTEKVFRDALTVLQTMDSKLTAPDGPFPLANESVNHYGTTQKYRCWQRGPNSVVRLTLSELYSDSFSRFIDKEFLVYEQERLTYGDTMSQAVALARELRSSYGCQRGSCIAIAGRNHPDWIISFIAITGHLAAMALPVNSWWMGEELRYGLEDSKASVLIADAFVLHRAPFLKDIGVEAICMRLDSSEAPVGMKHFRDVVKAGYYRPGGPPQAVDQDDNALLMYTSGTTSKPKGVVLTHRGIMTAMNFFAFISYNAGVSFVRPQLVSLLGSPLFHVNATHAGVFDAIINGHKLILMYRWSATRALELVETEKVVKLVGVPTMTYELVNHPDFENYDTSSLIGVGGGGSAFAAPMIKRVEKRFKNARAATGYGLTETNAPAAWMPATIFPFRPTSCGVPPVHVDVCIMDDSGKKLPLGTIGEICIRGANLMKEYWRKSEKTSEVFVIDSDGKLWFRSGDLGKMDEDQFIYIVDRAKDIIIRGGENISCAEVENAILAHPAVGEVAAVGMPHETLGEVVVVAIVFRPGADIPGIDELRLHASSKLANFKVPAEYYIMQGSLPQGATGKVQKSEIRNQLAKIQQENTGLVSKL